MRMGMEEAVLAHVRSFFDWLWAHLVKGVEGGGGVVVDSRCTGCLSNHPIATSWPLQGQNYSSRFISL